MSDMSIHLRDGLLSCQSHYPTFHNANAVKLEFEGKGGFSDRGTVTVFHLDPITAECLARIGQMDPAQRAAALPHLQRIMNPEEYA